MKPYQMGVAYCTPPTAKVAPVKTAYPGVRPWCVKKGMCLSITPPCADCVAHRVAMHNQNTSTTRRDPERLALRIVIAVMCVITFATVCGVAGYFAA